MCSMIDRFGAAALALGGLARLLLSSAADAKRKRRRPQVHRGAERRHLFGRRSQHKVALVATDPQSHPKQA